METVPSLAHQLGHSVAGTLVEVTKYLVAFPILFTVFENRVQADIVYSNSGNNICGFVQARGSYATEPPLRTNGRDIVVEEGGVWDKLPITVTGDFQISFQVYNNSGDGDSHLVILNKGTNGGVGVTNSPQGTDSPSINIVSATDFTDYEQYYFPTESENLASAPSQDFPNDAWTKIVVTKAGSLLTDDVGGQTIQSDISGPGLSTHLQIGLGGYATTNLGGAGELLYRDIVVTELDKPSAKAAIPRREESTVPEPHSLPLVAGGFLFGMVAFGLRRLETNRT